MYVLDGDSLVEKVTLFADTRCTSLLCHDARFDERTSKSAAMEIAWAYQEDGHRGANIATHVVREKGLCVMSTATMWWVEETENVFQGEDGFITLIHMSINEGMEPLIFGLKFTNASLV